MPKKLTNLRLPDDVRRRLIEQATKEERTITKVVIRALREYFNAHQKGE